MSSTNEKEVSHISDFLRSMMKSSDVTPEMAADCISKPIASFRNKLSLDRFSIKELIIIAELCDYHLAFVPDNVNQPTEFLLADKYISEDITTLKEYRKQRLQKHLDILNTYMDGMSIEEKTEFINQHLGNMIKGTEKIEPKK